MSVWSSLHCVGYVGKELAEREAVEDRGLDPFSKTHWHAKLSLRKLPALILILGSILSSVAVGLVSKLCTLSTNYMFVM